MDLKSNSDQSIPETKECYGYETLAPVEIRLLDLDSFLELINEYKIGTVWSCYGPDCNKFKHENGTLPIFDNQGPSPLVFFFVKDNIIFSAESKGFKKLKDYVSAKKGGFIDYRAFDLIEQISKRWDIHSVASLYYSSIRHEYKNFYDFYRSFHFYNYFQDYSTYLEEGAPAIEQGFKKYNDYVDAKERGFQSAADYYGAMSLHIRDECEYHDFKVLDGQMYDYGFDSPFEFHIFHNLNKLRGGQIIKLKDLKNKLQHESETYSREWYDKNLNEITVELLKNVLSNHKKFKELGKIISIEEQHATGIYRSYEAYSLYRNNLIYVDGSNVAWNHRSRRRGDAPFAKNIKVVVKELEKLGFREISVLCDNNLFDDVVDKDVYKRLSSSQKIYVVEKGKVADEWLLRFNKGKDCYIISGDKYRQYLNIYPELEKHIIDFQVIGDEAKFDEKIKEILDGIIPDDNFPALCHQFNGVEDF